MSHIGTEDDREDGSKERRPPSRVAVFTLHSSTGCSACMHVHCIALCISDRSSSNDRASIVEGALARIFQLFRDEIDHHIPRCTAIVCSVNDRFPWTRPPRTTQVALRSMGNV
jgi:hypothetical protein